MDLAREDISNKLVIFRSDRKKNGGEMSCLKRIRGYNMG